MNVRKSLTILLVIIGLALLISGYWLARLMWFKPFSIDHFYERVYIEFLWNDPEALSQTGILKPFGISGHEAELTDMSPNSVLRMAEIGQRNLDILERYDRNSLPAQGIVSFDVMHWFLKTGVEGEPFLFHDYPVTHISGPHIEVPQFLSGAHRIETENDIENYLSRLRKVDDKFGSLIDGLAKRKKEGIVVPTFIIERAISFCNHFTETPVDKNVLFTSFEEKLNNLALLEPKLKEEHLQGCRETIRDEVYPAYDRLAGYLLQLEQNSMSIAGTWQLPDGDTYYRYCLLQHTGVNNDPEELYELGKLEMNRLKGEINILLNILGHNGTDNAMKDLLSLASDSNLTFSTDDVGREICLGYFDKASKSITDLLPDYFNITPSIELSVLEVPEYRSSNSTFAFYIPPRGVPLSNGKMYVNTWKANHLTEFLATTYAYHEGIPGHHLQKGVQAELEELPTFRRFLPFTAYTEGWAMYAEQLGHEMTGTENPWDRLGMLQSDLFRTVRMLTDIGIHHKKWLREQAVEFMMENTGMAQQDVETEVDRYIVWPGQGCAYKVGQLKFLELREMTERELGEAFDIREFHDILIGQGAMPLQILEE
ncbi:MAG: DUF885 domain-containing protein, partial [Flavobacteriales bacterium]|nr:DUF885 domain-containing protein [Flavobacteriales bacterium]